MTQLQPIGPVEWSYAAEVVKTSCGDTMVGINGMFFRSESPVTTVRHMQELFGKRHRMAVWWYRQSYLTERFSLVPMEHPGDTLLDSLGKVFISLVPIQYAPPPPVEPKEKACTDDLIIVHANIPK